METNNDSTNNTAPVMVSNVNLAVDGVANKYAPYDAQLPIKISEGQRLVKCLYKTNKATGKAAGENSYILIPDSHLSESVIVDNAERLAPYVAAFLQAEEDKIIKQHHTSGGLGFSDSWLSLDKILAALDDAGQGNRLNKEKIESWFASDMQESLIVAFADKMGVSDTPTEQELAKLAEITSVYRAKFASLASGKTAYKVEEIDILQKALVVTGLDTDNSLGMRFMARLEGMKSVTSNDLLMAL